MSINATPNNFSCMSDLSLISLLETISHQTSPAPEILTALINLELADQPRCQAFNITPDTVETEIITRMQQFSALKTPLLQKLHPVITPTQLALTLWQFWLPFTRHLVNYQQSQGKPVIQGILGGQGTGKSTLVSALTLILESMGCRGVALSLDDVYKTYEERQQLRKQDPRLIWRGPPGTHDLTLADSVFRQFRAGTAPLELPQFDKSAWGGAGDRTTPKRVHRADILLFEGWFVGVQPLPDSQLIDLLKTQQFPPIVTETDQKFGRDMNQNLWDYVPLWQQLDRLMVLLPQDYRFSKQWRQSAEHLMKSQGKSGMSDGEISEFVDYFWKALHPLLFIEPLTQNDPRVDCVVRINADHSLLQISCLTKSLIDTFNR